MNIVFIVPTGIGAEKVTDGIPNRILKNTIIYLIHVGI